jgi:hypothetical protein
MLSQAGVRFAMAPELMADSRAEKADGVMPAGFFCCAARGATERNGAERLRSRLSLSLETPTGLAR